MMKIASTAATVSWIAARVVAISSFAATRAGTMIAYLAICAMKLHGLAGDRSAALTKLSVAALPTSITIIFCVAERFYRCWQSLSPSQNSCFA